MLSASCPPGNDKVLRNAPTANWRTPGYNFVRPDPSRRGEVRAGVVCGGGNSDADRIPGRGGANRALNKSGGPGAVVERDLLEARDRAGRRRAIPRR